MPKVSLGRLEMDVLVGLWQHSWIPGTPPLRNLIQGPLQSTEYSIKLVNFWNEIDGTGKAFLRSCLWSLSPKPAILMSRRILMIYLTGALTPAVYSVSNQHTSFSNLRRWLNTTLNGFGHSICLIKFNFSCGCALITRYQQTCTFTT